jgi:cytochrome c oxidase assembly protein Cox11
MGHIKEPVDFFVENKVVTEADRKQISEIIAYYKATGRKKLPAKRTKLSPRRKKHFA